MLQTNQRGNTSIHLFECKHSAFTKFWTLVLNIRTFSQNAAGSVVLAFHITLLKSKCIENECEGSVIKSTVGSVGVSVLMLATGASNNGSVIALGVFGPFVRCSWTLLEH